MVDTILQSVTRLPPFPAVIQRALQLIDNPRSSAQDVVEVIQYDHSITVDVLKLCNSASFGLRRTVHSLKDALVLIGFQQLLEIILSQASAKLFSRACDGYDLERGELWRHSVACALLPKIISKRLNREAKTAHFTAALLHDAGKIVLSQYVKDYAADIRKAIQEEHLSFIEAEKKVLGMDHAEVGSWIMEQWAFPKAIVSAVRYHHTPFLTLEDHEFVQLIYLSDLVAILTGIGGGADGLSYHGYEKVMQQYDLNITDIQRFIVQLEDQFQRVRKILKLNADVFASQPS